MEYIYAALLLHSTKQKISEANVKKVLTASGAKVDEAKVKALVSSLEGVKIDEAIKQATVPAPVAPVAKEQKPEGKKEENPEEEAKKAEEAAGGLANLFG